MITSLPDRDRRAVITGLGVVAPNGVGSEAWWAATLQGRGAIAPITRFDASRYATRHAGEVLHFDAEQHIERRLMVQTDRWTWMGLAAAELAFQDAAFDPAATRPVRDGCRHGQLVRRQRVRAGRDREALGPGTALRRRLPIDRLVLRRDHRRRSRSATA